MPEYEVITYSQHATQRMRQRRISRPEVALVLRIGEGYPEDDGTWIYELGHIRVVIIERDNAAHVVTVIRLRKTA